MELKEFIDSFVEQFDDTEASEITVYTKFKDLDEWSSLIAMGVIALVRTQYGKTVTGKEIRTCETVKDLFDLVSSK